MKPPDDRVKVEYGMDVTLVTLNDQSILEEQQIKELDQAIRPVIQKTQAKEVVLNFANVKFMSSSFLGLLVKIHKRVCEQGGHLQLRNLNANIRKVFEITQLTKIFDIS